MTTTRLYVPVAEQIAVSDAIEQAIAADDYEFVRALLRRLPCHESSGARLEMHSCTRRRTRFGVINMIYFVEASYAGRRLEPTTTTTHWFVLRVSNPHCYWHGYKTRNEVRALGFVQQFASTIPTPRLVAYQVVEPHERIEPTLHTTPAEVLERIEFLLMERIGGVELEALEPTLTAEQRVRVAESLVRVVSELGAAGERLLERAECRRIGSFTGGETTRHTFPDDEKDDDGHQELLVEEMQQLGRLIVDGPSIGPFESLPDQVRGYAAFLLAAIDSGIEVYERFRTELAPSLRYLLESVLPEYQRQHARHVGGAGGGGALPLRLIHSDLNLGNVLVDPETLELTAVLDWEHARLDVADLEWNNLAGSVSTLLQCESPNDEAVVKVLARRAAHCSRDCLTD